MQPVANREAVLIDARDGEGRPLVAIWSEPKRIYTRADGSLYALFDGKRWSLTRREDGALYIQLRGGVPHHGPAGQGEA